MSKDIHLYESGDGGEMKILNNDLVLSETLLQQVYLALFGGNVEASTKGNELEDEQRFDFWGNSLFHSNNTNKQFNSTTERLLEKVVLNSSGRIEIERAIEKDLSFLKNIVNLNIAVQILDSNRVNINIVLEKLDNKQKKELQIIWDNSKDEVVIQEKI